MSDITRCKNFGGHMHVWADGDFVNYDDHAAAIAEKDKRIIAAVSRCMEHQLANPLEDDGLAHDVISILEGESHE